MFWPMSRSSRVLRDVSRQLDVAPGADRATLAAIEDMPLAYLSGNSVVVRDVSVA